MFSKQEANDSIPVEHSSGIVVCSFGYQHAHEFNALMVFILPQATISFCCLPSA